MNILKENFQRLAGVLTLVIVCVGFVPAAIAASSYDVSAGYTITLTNVTDLSDNPVSTDDWIVGVEGIFEPSIPIITTGDGVANADTTSTINFLDYVFLDIDDVVTQTSTTDGTTNDGTAESAAGHGVYFQNIQNSSSQTLKFSFDYDITSIATATGDDAMAVANVIINGEYFLLAEAEAYSASGPTYDNQSTSGSFDIEVAPFGFTQLDVTISSFGSAASTAVIPVPAAIWLFGSGLIGLIGVARRKKS
jgi:hypothetical protein